MTFKIIEEITSFLNNSVSLFKNISNIGDIFIHKTPLNQDTYIGITYFEKRSQSDELMIANLRNASHVIFIGTSHRKLADFLIKVLDCDNKLNEITVLYACDKDGKARDKNFRETMFESIKKIGNIIGEESVYYKLNPNFNLSFYQMIHNCYFNGCKIDAKKFFISHQLYSKGMEAEEEHTIYFEEEQVAHDKFGNIFKCYNNAFNALLQKSNYIGKFQKDIWNLSVNEWNHFIDHSDAYKNSMKDVLRIIDDLKPKLPENKIRVMEVCSGTGQLIEMLLDKYTNFEIFFIDKSPKMISYCQNKQKIKHRATGYILDVTDRNINIDLFKELFGMDIIICHLSLPIPEIGIESFKNFLNFSNEILKHNRYLIISLLNTTIKIPDDNYKSDDDLLRQELKHISEDNLREKQKHLIEIDSFEKSIKEHNYKIEEKSKVKYKFQMKERIDMWKTPAILDTILNYEAVNKTQLKKKFMTINQNMGNKETSDMLVVHYLLKKVNNSLIG